MNHKLYLYYLCSVTFFDVAHYTIDSSLHLYYPSLSSQIPLQDPAEFPDTCNSLDPPPVPAVADKDNTGEGDNEEIPKAKSKAKKRKSNASSSSKKKKKADTCDNAPEDPKDVVASFLEGYQPIINALPVSLRPVSSRHGAHSYTLYLAIHSLGFIPPKLPM